MRRGDLVTIALRGDYGKPRPALVIQSDLFDRHPSLTVLPVTTELREAPLFRLRIEPSPTNGLLKTSEVMIDKVQSVLRDRIGERIGRISDDEIVAVNRALTVFLGIV